MAAPFSKDPGICGINEVEKDCTVSDVAKRHNVSVASVVRWHQHYRRFGSVDAKPMGGDCIGHCSGQHAGRIIGWVRKQLEITPEDMFGWLAEHGHRLSHSAVRHLLVRHSHTNKKTTGHTSEQDREDVKAKRQSWIWGQADLPATNLFFLDKTSTRMSPARGWTKCGERFNAATLHGHWKKITLSDAIGVNGIAAYSTFDRTIKGDSFRSFVRQDLGSCRDAGDIIIRDNLAAHKVSGIRESLVEAGA